VQEYDGGKAKYCAKGSKSNKTKYIKPEIAALNIKKQLKSNIENEKIEEFKSKPMQEHFCQDIERPSVDKER